MTLLYVIYQSPTELFKVNMKESMNKYMKQVTVAYSHEGECIARWKIFSKRNGQ